MLKLPVEARNSLESLHHLQSPQEERLKNAKQTISLKRAATDRAAMKNIEMNTIQLRPEAR
jgi:CHASE3 domain sensor protein